jgi:tricorn protease
MQFGTIIGRPSAGDVIGTSSVELLDGSRFRLPMVQSLSLDGKDLEGNRRPVDIDVPLSIGARAAGSDPQLDVAISTLLAQIDAAL